MYKVSGLDVFYKKVKNKIQKVQQMFMREPARTHGAQRGLKGEIKVNVMATNAK